VSAVKIVAPQTRCPACLALPLLRCRDDAGQLSDRVHRAREQRCENWMAQLICDHPFTPEQLPEGLRPVQRAVRSRDVCVVEDCGQRAVRHLSRGLEIADRVGGDPLDYVERR
jgi:hypothetical protein